MKQIEVHAHTPDRAESRLIKIADDATVEELVKLVQAEGAIIGELEEEILFLVENEEKLLKRGHKLSDCGIKHGHHVHFKKHDQEITIWIDKQKFEVKSHEMTVTQLLELAGDDPKQTTLALKEGNHLEKFTDLNKIICLKNGMHFVVFHNEPTPVS
jgi:uncharacterized ubiquitin-like protein YukD